MEYLNLFVYCKHTSLDSLITVPTAVRPVGWVPSGTVLAVFLFTVGHISWTVLCPVVLSRFQTLLHTLKDVNGFALTGN